MKQFKRPWFAIFTGLLMAVAVISCGKKDDPAPPVIPIPSITSFTPTTAGSGETVTITGANFTGATAVSFGGSAATSYIVTNATTITAVVGAGTTGEVAVVTPGGSAKLAGFTLKA